MLTKVFVQPSEFENPYYEVYSDVDDVAIPICTFKFSESVSYWYVQFNASWALSHLNLKEVSAFQEEINAKIEPKILGVL